MTLSIDFLKNRSRRELSLRFAEEIYALAIPHANSEKLTFIDGCIDKAAVASLGEPLSLVEARALNIYFTIFGIISSERGIYELADTLNELLQVRDMANVPRPSPIPHPPPK